MKTMKQIFTAIFALILVTGINFTSNAKDDSSSTVVEIAVANSDFSTLVEAVTKANLVDALSADGPFTVFAPTNAAFGRASG